MLHSGEESSGNVPSLLFIEEGKYMAGKSLGDVFATYVEVKIPLSIYGAGREKTTLVGFGLSIEGKKSDGIVEIGELTITGGKGVGLYANQGMNLSVRNCSIVMCQWRGVNAYNADISCDDLQVIGCFSSGVWAHNATITLSGEETSIQGNVTAGSSDCYGLHAASHGNTRFSKIQLVTPLTKEIISTNNGGGGNWGEYSTIEQIETPSKVVQHV